MARPPKGPGIVEGMDGSEQAKERLHVILETVSGEKTIAEACEELGIGESQFHKIRKEALSGALEQLEPRAVGRPGRGADGELAQEERIRELEEELKTLRIREHLTQASPDLELPPMTEGEKGGLTKGERARKKAERRAMGKGRKRSGRRG